MTANQRIAAYYSYLLGDTDDFATLPVPVTVEDGTLYRRCEARHSATGESPEEQVLAKLHIADDDAEKRYTADIHIINGKPVLIYDEMGGTS